VLYGVKFTVQNLAIANGGNSAGSGGGIYNGGETLTVTNSTFSGNTSNGAGGCIFNENPYGSGTRAAATLRNTIVANSTSGGNCAGEAIITDGGHNLDSDGTCGVGPATNPMLDPAGLANNGGPTKTITLQAGSPAIDAGNESVCAAPPVNNFDQRGYIRPGAGATSCSIGSYEYNSPGPPGCCQCPTSCAAPINGSCGDCVPVAGATCESGQLCNAAPFTPPATPTPTVTPTVTPTPTQTPTATNTPGANDCCQCSDFCAAPIVGTCGGCAVVFGASCTGGYCISRTPPTATNTRTPTRTAPPTFTPVPCAGDCNDDGTVTVDEILTMVNIALGNADATACPNGIPSGAQVDVALILTAVNNALNG
jgi:hypothetical protein